MGEQHHWRTSMSFLTADLREKGIETQGSKDVEEQLLSEVS